MALTTKIQTKNLADARADIPLHEVTKETTVHVHIDAPESTRREWKIASAQRGKSISMMVREAMKDYLSK